MKKTAETKTSEYHCEHCRRDFVRPSSFLKHMCEQKRRWMDKDKPQNRIAFLAWLKFYKQIQPTKKKRDYADFIGSAYYIGFLKYGSYCVDIGVVSPDNYVDHLLKNSVPLDSWNSDRVYSTYLTLHLRSEDGLDAVRRSVEYMMDLAEKENVELRDVFKYVNSNKICHLICGGKISPWMLYHSKTGPEFLAKLNDDQRSVIYEYIDPERWNIKFKRDPKETQIVSEVINSIGGL
jgi:hypothetical protein